MRLITLLFCGLLSLCGPQTHAADKKLNNLVSCLLQVSSTPRSPKPYTFSRASDGWVFISATCERSGPLIVNLDPHTNPEPIILSSSPAQGPIEAMHYVQ